MFLNRGTYSPLAMMLVLSAVTQSVEAAGAFRSQAEAAAEVCRANAKLQIPGKIVHAGVVHGAKAIRIEIQIRQSDGKGWIVLCDGSSGRILSKIDVDAI